MRNDTRNRAVLFAGVLALAAACGADDGGSADGAGAGSTAAEGAAQRPDGSPALAAFNDADVEFAQAMIVHHEQAIEMADIALDPAAAASPATRDLAARIKAAQDPEVQQLTALLQGWGRPVEMDTAHGHDMGDMGGMMTDEQMAALRRARGAALDALFRTMMIEHHRGAITMAQQARADGVNPEIDELAAGVIAVQKREIEEMSAG